MSSSNPTSPQVATHWTRLFYRDLDAPWREASEDGESTAEPRFGASSGGAAFGARTLTVAAAALLGAFASLALGVSGLDRRFAHDGDAQAQPACVRSGGPETGTASRRAPLPPSPTFA